jgi:hypothetical protein
MAVKGTNLKVRRERLVNAFFRALSDPDYVHSRMRTRAVRLAFNRLSDHMWAERERQRRV